MTPDAGLAATSCTWNDHMIAAGGISHDPNLAAAVASVFPDWRKGGENVGMGGTVSSLFDAFVASPGHYKNLVDPDFSRVGVCVGRDGNGKLFTTHRFAAVGAAAPAPPPPPPPPPPTTAAPPPPPTAPPTTAAPPPPPTAPPTTAAPPPTADRAADHSGSVDRRSDRAPDDGTDDDRLGRERPTGVPHFVARRRVAAFVDDRDRVNARRSRARPRRRDPRPVPVLSPPPPALTGWATARLEW